MILRENEQILEPSIEAAVSPKKQLESANRTILTADTGMLPTAALQACRLGLHFAAISFPVRRSAPRGITLSCSTIRRKLNFRSTHSTRDTLLRYEMHQQPNYSNYLTSTITIAIVQQTNTY